MRKVARRIAPATLARRLMAIQDAHVRAGHPSPTFDARVRTAIRTLATGRYPSELVQSGVASAKGHMSTVSAHVTPSLLNQLLDDSRHRTLMDRRDAAILLLCHAGLKRGTVVALNIEDLVWTENGLRVTIRSEGKGERQLTLRASGDALCAASACRVWLEHADLVDKTGPLFTRFTRSGAPVLSERLDAAYINKILKKRLQAVGVQDVSMYSAESLRKTASGGHS